MGTEIWILIVGLFIVGLATGVLVMFAAHENKKYIWVHLKTGNKYRIVANVCKMKRPDTREWLDAIVYMNDSGEWFIRWKDDFLLEFQTLEEWEDGRKK